MSTPESEDNKRWAKDARTHRQALKKATPPPVPNLFMARLSRQQGISRPPSRGPWVILAVLAIAAVGVYWAYGRYQTSTSMPAVSTSPTDSTVIASTETVVTPPLTSTTTVPAAAVAVSVAPVDSGSMNRTVVPDIREWRGPVSAVRESRTTLIRGRTAWRNLWEEMGHTDEAPRINFADYVVVGVFGGPRVPGAEVIIDEIHEQENSLTVPYRIREPQSAPGAALEPIYPYHVKILIRSDKAIRFALEPKKP